MPYNTRTRRAWPEALCFALFLVLLDVLLAYSLGRYHHGISALLLSVPLLASVFVAGAVASICWVVLRNP